MAVDVEDLALLVRRISRREELTSLYLLSASSAVEGLHIRGVRREFCSACRDTYPLHDRLAVG